MALDLEARPSKIAGPDAEPPRHRSLSVTGRTSPVFTSRRYSPSFVSRVRMPTVLIALWPTVPGGRGAGPYQAPSDTGVSPESSGAETGDSPSFSASSFSSSGWGSSRIELIPKLSRNLRVVP